MNAQVVQLSGGPVHASHFRSRRPYKIPPQDRNAVVRISTYHRKDDALSVIWFPARTHTNIVTSPLAVDSRPPASLGELDKLPLELVHHICLGIDMESLFRFRQINTRARKIVDALHEYRIITTHAMNAFCALLRTGVAPTVTLMDFYRLLCTQICSICQNRYGNYAHLLHWIRCCPVCVRHNPTEIQVSTLKSVKRVLKLSKMSLDELPKLTTLPGAYTWGERQRTMRIAMVSTASALSAYRKEHSGVEASQDVVEQLNMQQIFAYMACCALPSFDLRTRQVQNGVSCAGCQLAVETCIDSLKEDWVIDMYHTVYSHDGFLKHFERCKKAQRLWISSNGGTRRAPKLPHFCRMGGFISRE